MSGAPILLVVADEFNANLDDFTVAAGADGWTPGAESAGYDDLQGFFG